MPSSTTARILKPALISLFLLTLTIALGFAIHQALRDNTLGADYYIFWTAGRALVLEGQNPYAAEVTRQIQYGIYGREATAQEDPMPFNYPPYVLLATLPNLFMSFDYAQAFWMALNLVGLMTCLYLAFPRIPPLLLISIPFLYNYAFGMILGNFPVLMSAALIVFLGYFVLRGERSTAMQVGVGILLAWCTARPQAMWLYFVFILLYSLKQRLYVLLGSLAASGALMLGLSFLARPSWLAEWIQQIGMYVGYTNTYRPIVAFLWPFYWGKAIPEAVLRASSVGVGLAGLGLAGYVFYRWWRGQARAMTLIGVIGAVTYFFAPNSTSVSQLFLLVPLVLWCAWKGGERVSARVWWAVTLVISYAALAADSTGVFPAALRVWPVYGYLAWLAWLVWSERRRTGAADQAFF